MKNLILSAITMLSVGAFAQTNVCFNAPDGIENVWSGGWSYKQYTIPPGYKIDSIYADFDRTGYPVSQQDFIFSYCAGNTFDASNSVSPFNYSTTNTSLYDYWIDLTSFDYNSEGVIQILLPVNAGATWNDVCIAISPISNNVVCFSSPDGIETNWSGGWSYKDYVIPSGYKIDSVYANFDRNGYPISQHDFIFSYSVGSVFDAGNSTSPFNYSTTNTSLYDYWIDLTSFNYVAEGVIEVLLPVNAGATWNEVCIAQSLINQVICTQTVFDTITFTNTINVYDTITVTNTINVFDTTFVTNTDTNFVNVTQSNIQECFTTFDGVDNTWTGGWSYKEYIIPAGYKLDSIYGDFDRNGYPINQEDFIFSFTPGTQIYDENTSTSPLNYQTITTSMYDHWIDLSSYNYTNDGVIRLFLPVNAGASWNNLCFASSLISGVTCTQIVYDTITTNVTIQDTNYVTITDTNFVTITDTNYVTITDTNFVTITDTNYVTITDTNFVTINDTVYTHINVTDTLTIETSLGLPSPNEINIIKIYPNPASTHITINTGNFSLMNGYTIRIDNSLAQLVFTTQISQQDYFIDLATWSGNGTYFVYILDPQNNIVEVKKIILQ